MGDDWTHILFKHEAHLHQIQQTLIENSPCSVEKCNFMHRHHQNKEIKEYAQFDTISSVYAQVLDAAHFHLFHLFDVGMRSVIIDSDDNDDKKNENDRFYDAKFAQMIERVNGKRSNTQKFERFEVCNKFNLVQQSDDTNEQNKTFCDEMIAYLWSIGVHSIYTFALSQFLKKEQFDSDAIKADIDLLRANIFKQVKNEKIIASIKHFIAIIKSQSKLFSIGYRFYYWPKYKKIEELKYIGFGPRHINDHSGYKICELCVDAKYANFKEE